MRFLRRVSSVDVSRRLVGYVVTAVVDIVIAVVVVTVATTIFNNINFPRKQHLRTTTDCFQSGGTGSGLGTAVATMLQDSFGGIAGKTSVCQAVWPHSSGEVVLQNYNTLLSIAHLNQVRSQSMDKGETGKDRKR